MSSDEEIFRQNLNAYCLKMEWVSRKNATRGSPSALVRKLGKSDSFWSDLLNGNKSFSSDLAREIEKGLGLPKYALAGDAESTGGAKRTAQMLPFTSQPGALRPVLLQLAEKAGPLSAKLRVNVASLLGSIVEDPDNAQRYIDSLLPLLGEIEPGQLPATGTGGK